MILLRQNDYNWLRAAAMEQDGFPAGFPWNACAPAYERLREQGCVERVEAVIGKQRDGSPLIRSQAVATARGLQEIERRAALNVNRMGGRNAAG